MDEELEQRGVTPKSFFEQATETREMVQTVQKTSNSNLSLLNELKERVRKIEVKQFEEEDRRQKEEMEAKVKEQNEKTQGGVLGGDKGGVKDPEQKGLMGQVGSFISNFVGGIVGGAVGFTISGVGALVGGTMNLGKKALDLGKSIKEKLFGKKKDKKKKGGKVKIDKLLGEVEEEEEDKNVRGTGAKNRGREGGNFSGDQQKNERGQYALKDTEEAPKPKGEIKEEEVKAKFYADYINEGAEISEIGPGDFSIIYPDGRSSILTSVGMGGGGKTLEERFNDNVKGRIEYDKEKKKSDLEFGKRMHKSFPDKYNADGTRKKTKDKKKKKDKRGILGMIGGGIDKLTGNLTDFDRRGGKTFGATRVATGMLDFVTADMFDLDKRGKMDLFGMRKKMKKKRDKEAFENNPHVKNFRNQTKKLKEMGEGFPVDTTVNPDGSITSKFGGIRVGGEPVVGDTLSLKQRMVIKAKIQMGNKIEGIEKELYEKSGGGDFSEAEKKEIKELYGPKEGEKDPFDYYGDNNSEDAFGFNQGGLVQGYNQGGEVDSVAAMLTPGEFVVAKDAVQKVGVDTLKGLNASVGATNKPSLSSLEIGFGGDDYNPFEKKQMSYQGMDLGFTSTSKKTVDGKVVEDITKKEYLTPTQTKQKLTEMGIPYKELLNGTVIPDAAKMGAEMMPEFYETAKEAISRQFPEDLDFVPAPIREKLKKEYEKLQKRALEELDKFMTKMAGGGDFTDTAQIEAEMNRYIPGTIENIGLQITEEANKKYKPKKKGLFQIQKFNEGGLVQPVIESKNESGEMELIQTLSQTVDANSQNINVIQAQNQAMNPPNKSPQTTVPAEPSNTTLTGLQDTDAPIPFAVLLRQNAQRYLNLGNNAMVVS